MDSWVDKRASVLCGSVDLTPEAINQAQAEFDAGANLVNPEFVDPIIVLDLRKDLPPVLPCFYYPSKTGCRNNNECSKSHGVKGIGAKFETLEERKGRVASELVNGVPLLNLNNLADRKKPCRYLRRENGCRKGADCTYSHLPTSCKNFFSESGCNTENCTFSHSKLSCRHYFKAGGCRNGDSCGFSHELPEFAVKVKECAFFPSGCTNGPACAYNLVGETCEAK
jgi:hypothetical protein